jgi:hypothetical protein
MRYAPSSDKYSIVIADPPGFELQPARIQVPAESPPFQEWSFPDGTPWTQFHRRESGYLLRFPTLADFEVSADASCITCWPTPGTSDASVQQLFLNQVLPLVQSKRGKLVLHGSAVDIGAGAICFIGESGRGKSTLAASFATAGHGFLTDDGLVIEAFDGKLHVMPSHSSIRLWPDSEEALIWDGAPAAPPVQYSAKSRFLADPALPHCSEPRPLLGIYFLGEEDSITTRLTSLGPSEALILLVRHSFLLDVKERSLLRSHFDAVSRLAATSTFHQLEYPRDYQELPAVRATILANERRP